MLVVSIRSQYFYFAINMNSWIVLKCISFTMKTDVFTVSYFSFRLPRTQHFISKWTDLSKYTWSMLPVFSEVLVAQLPLIFFTCYIGYPMFFVVCLLFIFPVLSLSLDCILLIIIQILVLLILLSTYIYNCQLKTNLFKMSVQENDILPPKDIQCWQIIILKLV